MLKPQEDVNKAENEKKFFTNEFNLISTPTDRTSRAKTTDDFKMELGKLMKWVLSCAYARKRERSLLALPGFCSWDATVLQNVPF